MENKIFTGAVKDLYDVRDFMVKEVAGTTSQFNWQVGYDVEADLGITILDKDQGISFSCGGQAFGYYGGVLNAVFTGSYDEDSAKFIYAQVFLPGGGSSGRDCANLVANKGWGSETLTPSYEAKMPPSEVFMTKVSDITSDAFVEALTERAYSYANPYLDIDSIAQAIRDHHGVVIGVTGSNNGTWNSLFPQVPVKGEWNHWLYCGRAKIINGKKCIGVLNSWGKLVGENGWQWLSEEYFNPNLVWQAWTLVYKVPTPPVQKYVFIYPLSYGDENEEVKILQQHLQAAGFFPQSANCTGKFYDVTARSVQAWQVANGILDFQKEKNPKSIHFGNKSIRLANTLWSK